MEQLERILKTVMIHIGQLIKEVFANQPKSHTVNWFAEQLHCRRGNIYDIFNRPTIDTELLIRISLILDYDFFAHISQHINNKSNTETESVRKDRTE